MLLAILAASAIYPQMPAVHAYEAELASHCPNKHLEWLSPADAAGVINHFPRTLAPNNAEAVRDQVRNACHPATDTCASIATFRAAYRLSLSAKLAGQMCSLPIYCSGPKVCAKGR